MMYSNFLADGLFVATNIPSLKMLKNSPVRGPVFGLRPKFYIPFHFIPFQSKDAWNSDLRLIPKDLLKKS